MRQVRFSTAYADLARSQKSPAGVSFYSRLVNRPLGRVLAATAAALRVSPNQLTAFSGLLVVAAGAVLVTQPPGPLVGGAAALLLVLSFAVDSADGQLARLLGSGSHLGEWLDHLVDAGKAVVLHGAVLVAVLRFGQLPLAWLAFPLLFQLVSTLVFAGGTLRQLLGPRVELQGRAQHRSAVALLPADFGVISLVFLTYPWPLVFSVAYPVLLAANVVIGALLVAKWYRELEAPTDGRESPPGSTTAGP